MARELMTASSRFQPASTAPEARLLEHGRQPEAGPFHLGGPQSDGIFPQSGKPVSEGVPSVYAGRLLVPTARLTSVARPARGRCLGTDVLRG